MRKHFLSIPIAATIFLAMLIFIGCKKETSSSTLSTQEEEQAATFSTDAESSTETSFDDVFNNVLGVNDDVGNGSTGIFGRTTTAITGRGTNVDSLPPCVVVTIVPMQPGVFPKTVTIDFGAGCFSHGHHRSGKIRSTYTGHMTVSGSSVTTTFDNYKIDMVRVEGTHKITNTTGSSANPNQRQYTVDITDAKLTNPNGSYTQWNAHRVITQTEGNGTAAPADDIFKVTGSAHGKVKREDHIYLWDSEITEPLIKKFSCSWISKGRLRTIRIGLAPNSPWVAFLDYGNGTCDNVATVIINGSVHQITLP